MSAVNDAQLWNRTPPHDEAAEIGLLGGVLLDNDQWPGVSDLPADAFFLGRHRHIWASMHALMASTQAVDLITLTSSLASQPGLTASSTMLDEIGGPAYLIGLGEQTPYAYNTGAYAEIVRDRYARRLVLSHGLQVARAEAGMDTQPLPTADLQDLAARVPTPTQRATSHIITGATADQSAIAYLRLLGSGESPAIRTGFPDLDREFGGFHPGSLTVLGARPSMGKSSLAIGIAERVAARGKHVQVLSLEMKAFHIAMRQLCHAARVGLKPALSGELNELQMGRLSAAAERRALNGLPNYIDQPDTTLQAIERLSTHLKQAGRLDLLVIDYLGLISVPGRDGDENDTQKLGIISRALKTLAIQLDLPILVLHQLNRGLESRPDKRPKMADLRQSGRIEEDADNILFVYRDEYYNKESAYQGVGEIIIGKQRQGARDTSAKLQFHAESATFQSLASETSNLTM